MGIAGPTGRASPGGDAADGFRGMLLLLRGRLGLTQRELAARLGVHALLAPVTRVSVIPNAMRTRLLAYLLLGLFVASERLLRRGEAARSLAADAADRGTTRLIGLAYGAAVSAGLAAPVLSRLGVGGLRGNRPPVLGLAVMGLGLGIKVWAMRTLGRFYTRTLRTAGDQPVVEAGPYRLVRHPGYLGALLIWTGFGLTVRNWIAALAIEALTVVAYARRIAAEERMLVASLGAAYVGYQGRSWRLLPGVY